MAKLSSQEQKALSLFHAQLREAFSERLNGLELFGSKARGDATKFSDVDALVILDDQRIPVSQAERLYAAAPAGSELWLVPEAEHANGFAHGADEYTQKVAGYYTMRLGSCQAK